jgi:uncharacterized protein YkwD
MLPGDLSLILCERDAVVADFQKHGVLDAQISVKRLIPNNPQDHIKPSALRERALKHAMMTDNGGFAHGRCVDGSAWMVSMPARDQITLDGGAVHIPANVAASCINGSLDIRFVAEKRGRSLLVPRTPAANGDLVAKLPGMKGFLGVSCTLAQRVQSGPRELALVAVGGVALGGLTKDMENVRTEDDILRWINHRRAEESLKSLLSSQDLAAAAKSLMGRYAITHDLSAMAKLYQGLRGRGIEPLGENRAVGRSFAEIAMMFWQSPSHRDLLLNPRGRFYGAASQVTDNSAFLSLLVGDQSNAPVAKLGQ